MPICTNCHRDKLPAARGLCRACYSRWQKYGSAAERPRRKRAACQIDDCGKPAITHGMCDMHRTRLRRHGHLEETRPDSWGAKHKHPMFNSWAHLRRHRATHKIEPVWADDFLRFALDVGERPSKKHKLYAADDSKPIGPFNFVWKEAITQKVDGEDAQTYARRVQRVYRAVRKEAYQGYELKRHYGMSKAEYTAMLERQDHKCAICGQPEGSVIRGQKISLAVDHCHTKGQVRGLLCLHCNRGLGLMKDSPEILRRAAEYLEWPERLV